MEYKVCPICNTKNPMAANFCRCCGTPFPEKSKKGQTLKPIIRDCRIMTDYYTIGSTIEILWDVENTDEVYIDGEPVSHLGKYDYLVKSATTLDVKAENEFGFDFRKLKIAPKPLPKITKCHVSRNRIKAGETVKIYFDFQNKERAFLQSNFSKEINLVGKKKVEVTPKCGEKYTLVCYSKDPKVYVCQDIDISVIDEVKVNNFSVDRNNVIESTPVKLSWDVSNATSIIIKPINKVVTGTKDIILYPSKTTVYSIEAKNELSVVERSISVSVKPLPKLEYKMPDMSGLLNMPSVKLDLSRLIGNINELNVDQWMASPLKAKKESPFKICLAKYMRFFSEIKMPSISNLIPGDEIVQRSMRYALIIIAIFVLLGSILQWFNYTSFWVKILSLICVIVNVFYLTLICFLTRKKVSRRISMKGISLLYLFLTVSSIPSLLFLLCGGDYSLYEIYGEYILLEYDKLILPLAAFSFLSMSYWVCIMAIFNIQKKNNIYSKIKKKAYGI